MTRSSATGGATALGTQPPERLGRVRLRDGRHLAWSEWGPADGLPVLLCPGAATGRRLGFGTHLLDGLGVRLLSADRPGLGASDPRPGRTLLDWSHDVRELCGGLGLRLSGVVGFSQGAPFALAVAHAGLVPAAAVVAGTDELASPELLPLLAPPVAELVRAVDADPGAVERGAAAGADAEQLLRLVLDLSSPHDRGVYEQSPFAEAFGAAVREALAGGGEGYARDLVLSLSPWPFRPEDVHVPVHLLHGEQDHSPVHSPDHGLRLSRRLPTVTRTVLPDAGSSLLWTHSEVVLRSLLDVRSAAGPVEQQPERVQS